MEQLMSLIDENSERIPEGDYLQMCRIMKEMYKTKNILRVTPDVVSEDFIMTSEALNKCHKWIMASETLRESFIEHEKDPEDKVKLGIYKQIREASILIGVSLDIHKAMRSSCGLCIVVQTQREILDITGTRIIRT